MSHGFKSLVSQTAILYTRSFIQPQIWQSNRFRSGLLECHIRGDELWRTAAAELSHKHDVLSC